MLLGIVVGRQIVQVQTPVEQDRETLVRLVAPAVQAVVTTADLHG